jgi:uncharacterized protein (DUF3084 family)
MLRNVGNPGRRGPPLTPDGRQRAAGQRKRALDARQRAAEQREQEADQRDAKADQRDRLADQRDAKADQQDQLADQRDAKADQRDRDLLQESATARLYARLETLPVIEQAKGMIMEQSGCTEQEAFDLLRKASQRSNVPVRELAARIVRTRRLPKARPTPRDLRSEPPAP